jgi:hypothetical protein
MPRNYKYASARNLIMDISIPLFSPHLLAAAAVVALGLLAYPFSARLSVIFIGIGSVIAGAVVLTSMPEGFKVQTLILFGATVIVGAWMVAVGLKKQPGGGASR